jgi:hypothetical protein
MIAMFVLVRLPISFGGWTKQAYRTRNDYSLMIPHHFMRFANQVRVNAAVVSFFDRVFGMNRQTVRE